MYELSYAELYFTETCFPDFNEEAFEKAKQSVSAARSNRESIKSIIVKIQ